MVCAPVRVVAHPARTTLVVALAALALGCSTVAPKPKPIQDEVTPVSHESNACQVTIQSADSGTHALQFELRNHGDADVTLQTYQPFLGFTMEARADGQIVGVRQPALDIPVRPVTHIVPSGGSIPLDTPIRLRFEGDAKAVAEDGFLWTIARSSGPVELTFRLDLPPPFDAPCATTLP